MNSLSSNDRFGEEEFERADALRKQADDIGAARSALDSAANMARGLWISFISLSAYLAIAVGSVTHRMLFLEEPLQLPIINIKLPLVAFFWIAPILFLVLHAYLLLHLKFTGDNIREWERLAKRGLRTVPDDEGRSIEDSLRMQLPNFLLVQMLVPPKVNRAGIVYWALTTTVLITVIVGPVLLLSLIQLQFLPYHNWAVTWVHRLLIVADLGLIGLLWPLVLGHPIISWRIATRLATFGCAIAIFWLSVIIATFPGECMYQWSGLGIQMLRSYLFEGTTNEVSGRPNSWFSNRLVLTDQHFVDVGDDALKNVETIRSFRGRHLERAVLIRADLRKVDFTDAFMNEAILDQARLGGAKFGCGVTARNDDENDSLSTSNCTQLQSASLKGAELQGSEFWGTGLQGASFDGAELQGATLISAQLQGASLSLAKLQGAVLTRARLQCASLNGANFQGAILGGAHLQGAMLDDAQLQGAMLDSAQLQGASIANADFRGASLRGVFVWRAYGFNFGNFESVDFSNSLVGGFYRTIRGRMFKFDGASYEFFVMQSVDGILSDNLKKYIKDNLGFLDPGHISSEEHAKEFWKNRRADHNIRERANYLANLACRNDAAPFVTRTLTDDGFLAGGAIAGVGDDQRRSIAIHILDGLVMAKCPGAIGIGDAAMARLHSWAPDWKPENASTLSGNLRRLAVTFRAVLDPALFVAEDILRQN